jgi:hypothetical protein
MRQLAPWAGLVNGGGRTKSLSAFLRQRRVGGAPPSASAKSFSREGERWLQSWTCLFADASLLWRRAHQLDADWLKPLFY